VYISGKRVELSTNTKKVRPRAVASSDQVAIATGQSFIRDATFLLSGFFYVFFPYFLSF